MQIQFGSSLTRLVVLSIISASLIGCGGGGETPTGAASQLPPVSQTPPPSTPLVLPPADPTPTDPPQANRAPSIGGRAITTATAGQGYSFVPSATDADGDRLQFAISSMPAWATFDAATGRLSGAPANAQAGSYEEIEISVSDGALSAKLPQFAITVSAGAPSIHAVTLSWQPPTQNTDGSTLTNLSGYRIVYGSQPGSYTKSIDVANAGLMSYLVENLSAGRYYFAMIALSSEGSESDVSAEVSVNLG
ncbi:MAG: putative Ig domain-containing protein [Gammaproteobacteria bacterium]